MYCTCSATDKVLYYCEKISTVMQRLEQNLYTQPNTDISVLETCARNMASRGVKVTTQNLVAVGYSHEALQRPDIKRRVVELEALYTSVQSLGSEKVQVDISHTDPEGYAVTGFVGGDIL